MISLLGTWRSNWDLLCLELGHWTFILGSTEQADVCILTHCRGTNTNTQSYCDVHKETKTGTEKEDKSRHTGDLDSLYGLGGVVGDVNIDADRLSMVIQLHILHHGEKKQNNYYNDISKKFL